MGKKKAFLSILLSLIFVFTISTEAFAQTIQTQTKNIYKINEYDMYKALKAKSNQQLKAEGYTDNDIEKIKNFNMADEIKNRSKLDDNTLKSLGYTDEQINTLKNFDGSEAQMYALAATLTLYATSTVYNLGVANCYARLDYQFSWSACPTYVYTDGLGMSWSGGFLCSLDPSKTYCYISYQDTSNNYTQTKLVPNGSGWKCVPGQGMGWEFSLGTSVTGGYYKKWAYRGDGSVYITSAPAVANLQANLSYGHAYLNVSPGLNIGWPSIGFSTSVEETSYTFNVPAGY